jgi:hypothetical protein
MGMVVGGLLKGAPSVKTVSPVTSTQEGVLPWWGWGETLIRKGGLDEAVKSIVPEEGSAAVETLGSRISKPLMGRTTPSIPL